MAAIYRTMGGFKGESSKLMPLPSDKKVLSTPEDDDEDIEEVIKRVEKRFKNG